MSFEQQEQVLFDLLFDQDLRDQFCVDRVKALGKYDLDDAEQNDFKTIRPEALQLDAAMRADLVLSQLCKAFPISFSITSSLANGLDTLKQLIDTTTMRSKPVERASLFGNRLREQYPRFTFASDKELAIATAILEVELGMVWTSASLKQVVLDEGTPPATATDLGEDWLEKPIKLASYVSAAIIPQPYGQLKKACCPVADDCLWRQLNKTPLSLSARSRILQTEDPRLLTSRAMVSRFSICEPAVDFKTVELSEGFASLFQHVNGSMSVAQILAQLKQIGAPEQMLKGIETAFQQLLESEMLEFV
jgi:hypothetical protein